MPLNWGVVVLEEMKMTYKEYPKMLYTGDTEQWSCRAVQDADEEQEYREKGLVDYADLPEPEPELVAGGNAADAQSVGVSEDSAGAELKLSAAQTERDEALAEVERLKAIIEAGQQENEQLRAQVENGDANIKYAEPQTDLSELTNDAQQVNYSDLTIPELQKLLDEKGITYKSRDSKDTLIELLG